MTLAVPIAEIEGCAPHHMPRTRDGGWLISRAIATKLRRAPYRERIARAVKLLREPKVTDEVTEPPTVTVRVD